MITNNAFVIPIHSKISENTLSAFLFLPWTHEYQDPISSPIEQGRKLCIGNIAYCNRTKEIILFFVDGKNRLVRTAEFKTERPIADLQQAYSLYLLSSSLDIRYYSEEGIWRNQRFLKETIGFFVAGNKHHVIHSDSHRLLEFSSNLKLTESALRHSCSELESSLPFLIDKLFPGQQLVVSESTEKMVTDFLSSHNLSVYDDYFSRLTFEGVQQHKIKDLNISLIYAVQSGNRTNVEKLLATPGVNPNYGGYYNTALYYAVESYLAENMDQSKKNQWLQIADRLIKANAAVDRRISLNSITPYKLLQRDKNPSNNPLREIFKMEVISTEKDNSVTLHTELPTSVIVSPGGSEPRPSGSEIQLTNGRGSDPSGETMTKAEIPLSDSSELVESNEKMPTEAEPQKTTGLHTFSMYSEKEKQKHDVNSTSTHGGLSHRFDR